MNTKNIFRSMKSVTGRMGCLVAALAVGAFCAAAPAAHAAPITLIDLQWNGGSPAMSGNAATGSTYAGGGSTAPTTDFWNQATSPGYTSGLPLSLQTAANTPSGVTFSDTGYSGVGVYGGTVTSPSNTAAAPFYANVAPLYSSILYANAANTLALTFDGLAAGKYNVYLYSSGDNGSHLREISASANGGPGVTVGPGLGNTTMTSGANYAELSATVSASHVLSINVTSVAGEIDLNGLQIQANVPEPSSMILCGLGAIGLFIAARRRRKA